MKEDSKFPSLVGLPMLETLVLVDSREFPTCSVLNSQSRLGLDHPFDEDLEQGGDNLLNTESDMLPKCNQENM